MTLLHHVPRISEGLEYLLENDPVFCALPIKYSDFSWPYMGPGFPGLIRIVIAQQVSTAAAGSLWQRFQDGVPSVTPNAVLSLNDDDMRLLGLSYQKAGYIRGLARAVKEDGFDPRALEELPEEQIYEAITALKGFGRWSAEMYLIFCLARPDIWAPDDLGIQEGMRMYLRRKTRPGPEQTRKMGDRFKPYRTAASLLLWHSKGLWPE